MKCRNCKTTLKNIFVDLGFSPPSNNYLNKTDLKAEEKYLPLVVNVCHKCFLVQTEDYNSADDLFSNDYAYFSSTSKSWLNHAKEYCETIIKKINLLSSSFVVEIASNDGYLLKNFIEKKIPCIGVEPTLSTAKIAEKKGIPVIKDFFGFNLSKQIKKNYGSADLICGNNVYAHVPNINDFTSGLKNLLKPSGTITLEFPHLFNLIKYKQFDTIYHEHFSYLSLITVQKIFKANGLKIYDVTELGTHGGSLRVFGCHNDYAISVSENVKKIINMEKQFGLNKIRSYRHFQDKVEKIKFQFLNFLIKARLKGKLVCGYGAAAKGNTLINYSGVSSDLVSFVCDASKSKQNKYLPGSHIPVLPPSALKKFKPDFVIIFPWNIKEEVIEQNKFIYNWGGKFVTFIPHMKIYS